MDHKAVRRALVDWYRKAARALPWRIPPGDAARPDPYRVWLSEVMLQQTTTPHAGPYFERFVSRWPTVIDLARVEDADLMAAWAGLGYYARARNLLACARAVADQHGGVFPSDEAGLLALPGVGPYTAAAVAAIAFDQPANVVDGNVERVMARLFAVETPLPEGKPELRELAAEFVDPEAGAHGDWAQALMDLGATICRPKSPDCGRCPLSAHCLAKLTGEPEVYPRKTKKAARPRRHGLIFVAVRDGQVALVRRPERGLLGGMLALPTSDWRDAAFDEDEALSLAPSGGGWRATGFVEHVFTHFSLTLAVYRRDGVGSAPPEAIWTPLADASKGLPTVFAKALTRALG